MLSLDMRPGSRQFSGQVFIQGNKLGEFVRLHSKGLVIDDLKVNNEPAEIVQLENDEVELRPIRDSPLEDDHRADIKERWGVDCDTSIAIEFHGQISDTNMHGIYPCYYKIDGQQRELIATQFESHHAREAFPCVDEPAAKAKFLCQICTDDNNQVLGNMPIQQRNDVDGKSVVSFQITPRMSTYLLAFVVGELQYKTTKTRSGVDVNIYATPAQDPASLDFALETAANCIDFYNEYFGVRYPLPKSDHVALPDFSSGAMENWGLITYRETALLAGDNTAIASKQYIALVIAHELSHQWFGNLVTMEWWNDLWLNESFASLMEHVAIDKLFPDWDVWQIFETSDVISALKRDCLNGVQPVRQDVNHPDEISTLFDPSIVYAKGERLLKMLQAFIGEDSFRKGLQKYFSKHAYSNTVADDLWSCLATSSGIEVASLMSPWLTQSGYPVVYVNLKGDTINLRQEKFLADGTSDETIWPIPLFSSEDSAPKLMQDRETSFRVNNVDNFQLNIGNNAHFISVYDDILNQKILSKITSFSSTDRAKLLNELLLMVQPGIVHTAKILDFLPMYANEDDDSVWDIMAMAIGVIGRFVEPSSQEEKQLRDLSGVLARRQYERLGWDVKSPDSMNDRKLRSTIIAEMLFAEDKKAIDESLSIYSKFKYDLNKIDGDIRTAVLSSVVRNGEHDDFEYLISQYKLLQDADLKQDIASALSSTRDNDQIDEIVSLLNNTSVIKVQDLFYWYIWMLRNRYARSKTWDWMETQWSWIDKTFGDDKSYDMFPRYAGQILQSHNDLSKYRDFFTPKIIEPALKRAIDIGIKEISIRADWIERDKSLVIEKLAQSSK